MPSFPGFSSAPRQKQRLPEDFSIYLDFVRIFAAAAVFLHHMGLPPVLDRIRDFLQPGLDAVTVFFVLSGYVIAYATDHFEKDPRTYALHRVARIMPVALAALLLAAVLDPFTLSVSHLSYWKENWASFLTSPLFLNRIWWAKIDALSAGAYWSLNYEVWSYVFFGMLLFAPGKMRWWLAAGVVLLMGPKFALAIPLWLAGVWAYRLGQIPLKRRTALLLAAVPPLLYVGLKFFEPDQLARFYVGQAMEDWAGHLLYAGKYSAWYYILALLVVLHFWGMRYLDLKFLSTPAWARPIRLAASYTFSFYLFHMTVSRFFIKSLAKIDALGLAGRYALAYVLTILCIPVLANYTERRKVQVRAFLRKRFPAVFARA